MRSRKKYFAAAVGVAAAMACMPAVASATVSASITGDGGTPVALTPAAPPTLGNMDPDVAVHVDTTDAAGYIWSVTAPGGAQVAETDFFCWNPDPIATRDYTIGYHGNGVYQLTLTLYSDDNCKTVKSQTVYPFTIASGVTLGPSGGSYLLNSTIAFDSAVSPNGSASYVYGLNAAVQPDGSLAGTTQPAFRDPTTGKVSVTPTVPGQYTIVGHATWDAQTFTPWTAPVSFHVYAPFKLATLTFPRNRAPHFQLKASVQYGNGGRVTVSQAYGKHGKHFRTLGKPKLSSKGTFRVNFTNRKLGWYRFRFSYKGSSAVAKGTYYLSAKLKRL